MSETLTPDICVIGAGAAGLSVAAGAAAFGAPVVLIERGTMGGECLNVGCVPSKAMIAAARHAHQARESGPFGIRIGAVEADFEAVMAHVHATIAAIAPNDSEERFTGLGVHVIRASAAFEDARTLVAGGVRITPRRFVVATGSRPAVPPIPGLRDVPFLTNETIFANMTRPEHLLVIGGGPIGIEMAQAHRRLGSAVTVVQSGTILSRDDPEAVDVVRAALLREGVALIEHADVLSVQTSGQGAAASIRHEGAERVLSGSHLLVAAGREAVLEDLNLPAAGIAATERGIGVDARMKTSNPRVFAIGDVSDGPHFTHVANYQAGIVLRQILFRLPVKVRPGIIPWVTFTDPELAHVGLREEEARKEHGKVRVLRSDYHENDRAQTERATAGFIKVVTTARGGILGVTIVGREAGEIINMWALAVSAGLNIRAVTGYISPYPTFSEVGKRAAISFFTPGLTNPLLRRTLGALRHFG